MIDVTRLGGESLVVNVDQILTIEETPDTIIALSNGERILVRETSGELIARVVAYRTRLAEALRGAAGRHGA